MNKIFRVIWNHATQSWVAVSELTSAKGKTKSKTISKLAALSVVAGALSMDVIAAETANIPAAAISTSDNGIFIGPKGKTSATAQTAGKSVKNVIIIGNRNGVADEGIVIGNDITSSASGIAADTLIGNRIRLGGGGSDSMSTALGYGVQVAGPSLAAGIGARSDIADASGWQAVQNGGVALGGFASVGGNQNGGVAIGAIAEGDQNGSVAIGQLSGATRQFFDREVTGSGGNGAVYNINENDGNTLTSIGHKAVARADSGVAVGRQANTSRYGRNAVAVGTFATAIKENAVAMGNNAVAGGYTAAEKEAIQAKIKELKGENFLVKAEARLEAAKAKLEADASAENKFNYASAKAAVERIKLAIARLENDLQFNAAEEIDASSAIAIGNQAKATNQSALAQGDRATATGKRAIAQGTQANSTGEDAIAQGTETKATGSYAIAQGRKAEATAENAIAVGTSSNVSGANSVALGANIAKLTTENSVVLGANSTEVVGTTGASHAVQTVNDATVRTIAGPNFTYSGFAGTVADAGRYVSIGQVGTERQIKNLAAGAVTPTSTDAINGSQLYALMDRVENKQEPVVYTNKDGDKLVKVGNDFYKTGDLDPATGKPLAGKTPVSAGDVIASMNNAGNDTKTPMALANIAGNLPGAKNGSTAPTTSGTLPEGDDAPNTSNAATVGDVLNAGWNLTQKGEARDFVKPYDTVDFIDGKGTSVNVTTDTDGKVSHIKYDVKAADDSITVGDDGIKVNTGGITPVTKDDGDKKSGQVAPNKGDENKVASVGDVANAINNAFWKVTGAEDGGKFADGNTTTEEQVKAGDKVTFKAGKNIKLKQDGKNFTYSLNPELTDITSIGGKGTTMTFKPEGVDLGDKNITGVKSALNTTPVTTTPDGSPTPEADKPNLVDLVGTKDAPVNKNAAATVGDLQNMGWVVGAPENGYVDTVKNANKVDFKGENGISVTGKTNDKGVREITIAVKDGEVVKPNQFTAKVNGTDTPVTKVGDQYYNTADIDPKTGKPKADKKPVTPDAGTTPTNAGDGYVTGNKVAAAIQKSGFVVGKQKDALSAADFKDEDEKVNPDDELRFADGNNTKVKLATKESVDKDGNKVTTTTVKVDVTGLPVQYTAKVNGKDTPVTKVGDKYFTVDDKGNPTTTEVAPADLTTNMVNPAAKPNEIGAPTTLGNVKSNLPSVNDADKNAKDVDGNPIAGKDNKSAPIDAAKAADIAKNVGNNAATVSDVLNAGWNLQNNGKAKDFVKPYDTVNFVDGKGTKAVVKTEEDGTTSNVKFDIDTGSITNNADGSVQGPVVTPEMTKALEDATNTLNNLPATAPAAVRKAAEQAVADAANNIANVANKVATAQDVANAINKSGFTLTTSANGGEKISGTPEMINPGKKVEMVAGKNMTVKQESNGKVTYATASNVTFDSVQFGDNGPKITNNGGNINVGTATGAPTKITGVAPGEISATSKDAVNGSQLYAMGNKLQGQINKLGKRMNAGMATSAAMANLLQPHKSGQSVVTAGVGQHKNQSAVAVGYSRLSDNGKYGVRFSMGANTQGEVTSGAAVGYFW